MSKTVSEQIRDLENTRAAKAAQMQGVLQKSLDEGRSTDEAEAEEFDTLEGEIKQIDADLVRLKRMEALLAQSAKAVSGNSAPAASTARQITGAPSIIVQRDAEEKFKGQNYVRMVIARTAAKLFDTSATRIAMDRWGKTNPLLVELIKANEVPGGGSGSGEWGAELVSADNRYTGDFIEYLYSQTIYNRLGLREVPAHVAIKGQDGQATGYWVGESKPIPATTVDFSTVNLTPLKVAALAVVSNELLRDSSPAAEALVRDALVWAAVQRIDGTFLSASAASAGVSPAGMLNGVTAISTSGSDGDGLRADIKALYAPFIAANNASGLSFVASTSLAKSIQLMRNALGQREFEGVTQMGGTLEGDPLVTGDNVSASHLILLKPSDIYRIGAMGIEVSMSRDATIEQNTIPTGATDTPVGMSTAATNMFQTESTAIKIVQSINFAKRRSHVVQYVNDAAYGTIGTP